MTIGLFFLSIFIMAGALTLGTVVVVNSLAENDLELNMYGAGIILACILLFITSGIVLANLILLMGA